MPFNLLLLPLLGGFLFLTYWNPTRFDSNRYSGERLIFFAAAAGVGLLSLAFLITRGVLRFWPAIGASWHSVVPFPYSGTSFLAFLLGAFGWWPLNRVLHPQDKEARRTIQDWNDFLEVLLERAQRDVKLISLTLKSRKVYVGIVTRSFDPVNERKHIAILPIKSGFRDFHNLELTFTTDYARVYAQIIRRQVSVAAGGIRDFEIVIPVSEIEAASLFDPQAYDLFNPPVPSGSRH